MKLIATNEEMINIAYHALTTGLPFFVDYGFELSYDDDEYEDAKAELNADDMPIKGSICIEDVQAQMLRKGKGLTFTDMESEDKHILTLELIKKNWDTIPVSRIMNVMNENYDGEDADIIMQYMLFGSVVYG